jgi:hypothetical protein
MVALGCFGVKIGDGGDVSVGVTEHPEMPWWMVLVFVAVVAKELFLLFCMIMAGELVPAGRYARPNRKEWLLDVVLVAHACPGCSATWSLISMNTPLGSDNPGMFVVNLLLSSLLFLIFYLPLRIPYLLEERARLSGGRDWLVLILSILVVMVPAIARLP